MTGVQVGTQWMEILEKTDEVDLSGFRVEALDGSAGTIEQMLYWSDARMPDYVVIDTGRWLFGHKSVLSIRLVEEIDLENRCLKVPLSKRQIREAPEFLPIT